MNVIKWINELSRAYGVKSSLQSSTITLHTCQKGCFDEVWILNIGQCGLPIVNWNDNRNQECCKKQERRRGRLHVISGALMMTS